MGSKDWARAAILRKRVLPVRTRLMLEDIASNADSLVRNKDYDIYPAMMESLKFSKYSDVVRDLSYSDAVLIYQMNKGRYGGLVTREERRDEIQRRNLQANNLKYQPQKSEVKKPEQLLLF